MSPNRREGIETMGNPARPWPRWLAAVLATSCVGWAAVAMRREAAANRLPYDNRQAVADFQLRLVEPDLPHGQAFAWHDPRVAGWLADGGMRHTVVGTVRQAGRALAVRPWLYTSRWLAQPVVAVQDGRFVAELTFDARWNDDLLLRLELEDTATGQVVGDWSYAFRGEGKR